MAKTTNLLVLLFLLQFGLSACDADNSEALNSDNVITGTTPSENTSTLSPSSPDTADNFETATVQLDGRWISSCATRDPQEQTGFEQEHLVVEGAFYDRTINFYEDTNCLVPADISFLRVQSTGLQYPGGLVETELGWASQIVVTSRAIDFDTRLLTGDDAALYDPALYYYDFYLIESDGQLHFGSMNTWSADQFEQNLDSPHIFYAE